MKKWIGQHRRALNKAWHDESRAREITFDAFCAEMWAIWQSLEKCGVKHAA